MSIESTQRILDRESRLTNAEVEAARQKAIAWLVANDPNGCYTDAQCEAEDMSPLSLYDALTLVEQQISR